MKFQEKLVQLRKGNDLSQEQLAEKLGVSRQAISRWEAGDTTPDITNLLGICMYFGVSSDYLICDDYQPDVETETTQPQADAKQAARGRRKLAHFCFMIGFVIAALMVAIMGAFLSTIHPMSLVLSFLCVALVNLFLWLCS
ncbi:MAG: helix-turn-helix transcriptional regulator [Lachnospiraceae bacterium]|nr:helix-turn-helix transcriptional regulator [Lachnospiraceae bacterium]